MRALWYHGHYWHKYYSGRQSYPGFPHTLENSEKWPFHGIAGKSQGIYQVPSGNLWKQQNLREYSGNCYGRFKCCFWWWYVVFHMFCPQFPDKIPTKLLDNKPFTNSLRVNICNIYIYPWWLGKWPACTHEKPYVMDLKLIGVINVSYMFCTSYFLQILPAFSKLINERKTEKQRIVNFDGKWRPDWINGDGGVRRPNYFAIYYRSTRSLQGNMKICQGNLREFSGKKLCESVGILLAFPLVQFYGTGTV